MNLKRIALIGIGEQGLNNLLPAINEVKNSKLVAICDLDIAKTQPLTDKYGIPAYANYKDLIGTEQLDGLIIACPAQVHYEIAKYAIEHKLNIFIENQQHYTHMK